MRNTKVLIRIVLAIAVCLQVTLPALGQKAFDEYLIDKTFVPYSGSTSQSLPTSTSDATVTIDPSTEIHQIRQSLFGQNAVGYQGNFDSTSNEEKNWKAGNFSLLRYPGGNWSNDFFWDGNMPSSIQVENKHNGNVSSLRDGTTGWMLETDEFPDFLEYTGADGIVCVNVAYAFYGTDPDPVQTAADYAADWVNYYNNTLGVGVKYWELGNENYGPWQAGFDLGSAQQYGDACVEFANAMKAVDPTIKIGVVLYEGYGGFNSTPQAVDWNETVLPIVEDIMDFAIIHHYPHPNTNHSAITEPEIYDAISVVEETYDMIHDQVATYTSKPADYYPVAITEFNARAGIRNMSRTNTLFTTLMLCEYAKYDYGAAMQWDLVNGFDTDAGDHGLVARRDPFLQTGDVNPEFYAFYYLNKYLGDRLIESSSNDGDIISYASTFSSGEMGVVIVNRGDADKTVEIDLGSFQPGQNMYWHTVNGDYSDFDRTVYINGVGPDTTFTIGQSYTSNFGSNENTETATAYEANGVSGPQDYESVMPYSSNIPAGNLKFSAPRYSVSYIVFEAVDDDCAAPQLGPDQTLCGVSDITLETGLTSSGKTFTWKNGVGTTIGTSSTLVVNTADTYTVEVDSNGCVITDQITITDEIPSFELGSDVHLCETNSLSVSVGNTNSAIAVSWTKDGSAFADSDTITVTAAGVYEATASAAGCADVTDQITVTSDLVDVTGDTVCSSGETATLTINTAGSFEWFDSETGGTSLSSSSSYSPVVTSSTTYYVEDISTTQSTYGKSAIDGNTWGNTSAGAYSGWGRELELVLETDVTLVSIDINVNATANVVFNISDGASYNNTFNFNGLSTGFQTINFNEPLSAGTYTIDLVGTTGGVSIQYDNNGSNSYPGVMSFSATGGGTEDIYGMFFNWVLETGSSCARTPVYAVLDPSNPSCGPTDCNGEVGGTATIDDCGECSGGSTGITPNSTCTQDCNGEWGGTASIDDCGECSGGTTGITPNSTCVQDCAGEWGGTASIDDCGACTGGSTGVTPNSTCTQDCNGDWGGTAYIDGCSQCVGGNTGELPCDDDCHGDPGGSASIDNCGVCSGGATGVTPNSTCVQDCNGEWDGTASVDDCGICSGGSTGITPNSTCVQDCNGDWDGTASLDVCGTCSGGNTGVTPETDINNCVTAIADEDIRELSVYPNPTENILYISESAPYEVYNSVGALMNSGSADQIDMSALPSGLYIVRVGGIVFRVTKN